MIKIGKASLRIALIALTAAALHSSAMAAIQASVDRTEVPQDESISFKVTMTGDSSPLNPKFDAPDFEVMNQFENSQFSSVYINGKFENKSEHSITFILRPTKTGSLHIRNIVNNGEKAPDITVQVVQENAYKRTVPGEAPSLQGDNKNFFVKSEVSKSRAYKGEQIIVSYYLYRRTRVNLRDVMQYPNFQGFIREDLEMPILSGRPDYEAVNMGGVPFERALLARYAIYPIKEGKLKIDGFSIRADYIPKNSGSDDAFEDPFFQFFSQVTPRTGTSKSDPVTIDSIPLPEEGKTAQFTGGVGDFEIYATLENVNNIKANAPITIQVSVKGKGNTSLVEFPPVNWPKEFKFYESQGKSKNLGQGMSEKTFEVVVVPLQKGSFQIPAFEFEFFNPENRTYVRKKTVPIPIEVAEGDPNSAAVLANQSPDPAVIGGDKNATKPGFGSLRLNDSKQTDGAAVFLGQPWWRWVAWFGLLVFFSFIGLVIFDSAKKRSLARLEILRRRQNYDSFWTKLEKEAQEKAASAPLPELAALLDEGVDQLYKTLDETFQISSRALPQRELAKALTVEHGVPQEQWRKMAEILDFTEMLRFASGSGVVEESKARARIPELVNQTHQICDQIAIKKLDN